MKIAVLALVAISLLNTACSATADVTRPAQGAPSTAVSAPPPPANLAAFERSGTHGPLLPGERRWSPNARVIPATGAVPQISAKQAEQGPAAGYARGKTVYAQPIYYTDDGATGLGPDGKLPKDPKYRLFVNRLIWLLVYPNATSQIDGLTGRAPFFTAVDATTGKPLLSWQTSRDVEERASGAPPDW